jgi:hypothetical protein
MTSRRLRGSEVCTATKQYIQAERTLLCASNREAVCLEPSRLNDWMVLGTEFIVCLGPTNRVPRTGRVCAWDRDLTAKRGFIQLIIRYKRGRQYL